MLRGGKASRCLLRWRKWQGQRSNGTGARNVLQRGVGAHGNGNGGRRGFTAGGCTAIKTVLVVAARRAVGESEVAVVFPDSFSFSVFAVVKQFQRHGVRAFLSIRDARHHHPVIAASRQLSNGISAAAATGLRRWCVGAVRWWCHNWCCWRWWWWFGSIGRCCPRQWWWWWCGEPDSPTR